MNYDLCAFFFNRISPLIFIGSVLYIFMLYLNIKHEILYYNTANDKNIYWSI